MENFCSSAFQDLTKKEFTDCSFKFEEEDGSKNYIFAHKLILKMVSPAMLPGPPKDDLPIPIKDIPMKTFRQLIWNIYGQKIDLKDAEEACELYKAAEKYNLRDALEIARSFMLKTVNISNVSAYHDIASRFDDAELLTVCDNFFTSSACNLMSKPEFFVSTEPIISSETDLEVHDIKVDSPLNIDLNLCVELINQETCKEFQVSKKLGLIRFLISNAIKLFATIIPSTTAQLNILVNAENINSVISAGQTKLNDSFNTLFDGDNFKSLMGFVSSHFENFQCTVCDQVINECRMYCEDCKANIDITYMFHELCMLIKFYQKDELRRIKDHKETLKDFLDLLNVFEVPQDV